jgi:hypothetical protein
VDELFDCRHPLGQRFQQRQEHRVGEQHAVCSMVDDKRDLFREQARIDGVANVTGAADTVVGLEVPVVIPGKSSHPVAVFQSQPFQGIGQLPGAPDALAKGIGMMRIVDRYRNDFPVRIIALRVPQD